MSTARDTTQVLTAYATEALTVDNTAGGVGCTASKLARAVAPYQQAQKITVDVEAQPIRYTLDGTAPTTSVGRPVAAGVSFDVWGYENIVAFRAIRSGGTNSTCTVTYFY